MRIYKYPLVLDYSVRKYRLPKGCKYLTLQIQNGIACFWVEFNPELDEMEDKFLAFFGTGWDFSIGGSDAKAKIYIGTLVKGDLVYHLYEVI